MELQRPIFIIGYPRSGTTLLRLMLNNHEDLLIPPECGFIQWWHKKYSKLNIRDFNVLEFIKDILTSKKIEHWNFEEEALSNYLSSVSFNTYAEICSHVYNFYGIMQGRNCLRWGDKNNYYIYHLDLIMNLYPDAQIIHIIRDVRDIVSSYKKLLVINDKTKYFPSLNKNVEELAEDWLDSNIGVINNFSKLTTSSIMNVRYEDLVSNSIATNKDICSFLSIPFSYGMSEYYLNNRNNKIEPTDFIKWKEKTLNPPDTSSIGQYKEILSNNEIEKVEEICSTLLKFYYS